MNVDYSQRIVYLQCNRRSATCKPILRTRIFLFGAGASYGAGGILPERPPLGNQLYAELARSYPGSWGSLPSHVRSRIEENFEVGMRVVHDEFYAAVPQLMREMAVYFIQFRPARRSSLYCRLIDVLVGNNLVANSLMSTLNYECTLEFSALEAGLHISYFDDGGETDLPVWKLHGSCNMFSAEVQAGPGIAYGPGIAWEGGIRALPSADAVIQHCLTETALAPVMCLYMEGKPLSVSPSTIRDMQKRWAQAVASAQSIFCIGVRPVPADDHIWNPLHASAAHLHFIGDRDAFEAWARGRGSASSYLGSRFDSSFGALTEALLARADQ